MPPPTVIDQVLSDAAKTLTPDKSLDRAESHAKYLFSTVTIFGTLLTGFGILSGNKAIARDPWLLAIPLTLICVSLALSMYVLTPRGGVVNLDNLFSVGNYFEKLIWWRGRAIFAAGILFALALISIIPVIAFGNRNLVNATLTAKATRAADSDNIAASFKYEGLPPGTLATITATATRTDGANFPVFEQISKPHDGGDLTGDIAIPEGTEVRQLTIRAKATSGTRVIHDDTITLMLAPRPAPALRSRRRNLFGR
jgi:hypothetical protein